MNQTGEQLPPDVTSEAMKTIPHETWNTCPACGDSWRDVKHTPGVIHRTVRCRRCARS